MFFLINLVYWVLGVVIAFAGSAMIGMLFNTLIALIKAPMRPANLKLFLGYSFCAFVAYCVMLGCLFAGGWIGDYGRANEIDFNGNWLLYGAIFPGIISLSIVFPFIRVGLAQTSGIDVDVDRDNNVTHREN